MALVCCFLAITATVLVPTANAKEYYDGVSLTCDRDGIGAGCTYEIIFDEAAPIGGFCEGETIWSGCWS